jgi:glycosyltransferase involved in cell wall biosynthesis
VNGAPRTVLHLSSTSGPGGAETLVKRLAASLDPARFRSIVCLFRRGWLYDATQHLGIPTSVIGIDGAFDLQWARAFAALVRKERVAAIHAHEFTANSYGSLMGQILGVPVVATVHGKSYFADRAKRRMAYRYVSRVSRMVAVCEDLKTFIVQRAGIAERRVSVIYNGVEAPVPTADRAGAIRAELSLQTFEHVIGAVGSLYPVKGHVHLIRAMPSILRAFPRALLLLVGQGELEQPLKTEAARLRLGEHVRFLGFRGDVPALLSLFDAFVLPSLSEGLSMALLEAMAAGKPVVATRVGGNPEAVVEGDTGFLVDAESPASLADAIARLLRDKAQAARMGERGRRRVREKFSFSATVEQYQRHYEQPAAQ